MITLETIKAELLENHNVRTRKMSDSEIYAAALAHDVISQAEYNSAPTMPATPKAPTIAPTTTIEKQDEKTMTNAQKTKAEQLAELLADMGNNAQLDEPRVIELIKANTTQVRQTSVTLTTPSATTTKNVGVTHECFDNALNWLSIGCDVFFHGATGAGKSTTASMLADALNMDFFVMGALLSKFEVLGSLTPNAYIASIIREWLDCDSDDGALLCIDEIDASCARALVTVMALFDEKGCITFPDGVTKQRTEKHRIVITGNTVGAGAGADYNGRVRLDKATLNRFVTIEHGYSKNIESSIACPALLDYANAFRRLLDNKGLRGAIISPRTLKQAQRVIDAGFTATVKNAMLGDAFKQSLSQSEYDSVTNAIENRVNDALISAL